MGTEFRCQALIQCLLTVLGWQCQFLSSVVMMRFALSEMSLIETESSFGNMGWNRMDLVILDPVYGYSADEYC